MAKPKRREDNSNMNNIVEEMFFSNTKKHIEKTNDISDINNVSDINHIINITNLSNINDINEMNNINNISEINDITKTNKNKKQKTYTEQMPLYLTPEMKKHISDSAWKNRLKEQEYVRSLIEKDIKENPLN